MQVTAVRLKLILSSIQTDFGLNKVDLNDLKIIERFEIELLN